MCNVPYINTLNRLFRWYARRKYPSLADDLVNGMWAGLAELQARDPERFGTLLRQKPAYILNHCWWHYALPYLRKELRRVAEPLDQTRLTEPFRGRPLKVEQPGERLKPPAETFTLSEDEWRTHLYNLCAARTWSQPALEPLDVEAWLAGLTPPVADAAVRLLCGFTEEELGWPGRQAKAAFRALCAELGVDDIRRIHGPLAALLPPE